MDGQKRQAAFFDLDKTLIPGSSLFLMARGAYERDLFRVRDLMRFGWGQMMFRWKGEDAKGMEMSRSDTLDFVSGRSQDELLAMGEIVEERIIPRVYADLVNVIQAHQGRGDLTFLVTAAPIELAETVAQQLKMDGAIATISEVDEHGYYTGRIAGEVMHGPAKAKAVADKAAELGIDLYDCSAYSTR